VSTTLGSEILCSARCRIDVSRIRVNAKHHLHAQVAGSCKPFRSFVAGGCQDYRRLHELLGGQVRGSWCNGDVSPTTFALPLIHDRMADAVWWKMTETGIIRMFHHLTVPSTRSIRSKSICCVLLLLASLPGWAADAGGFFRLEACSLLEGTRIHLDSYRGNKLSKPLVFSVPWGLVNMDFVEVPGMMCGEGMPCESATKSKIQITHVSRGKLRTVSGDFSISFADGQTFQGSFKVKERKPTVSSCE